MTPVTAHFTASLRVIHRSSPPAARVQAVVTSPAGTTTTIRMRIEHGTRRDGTWRGTLRLPPQSPVGTWHVRFQARSATGHTATDPNRPAFTVTKRAYPPVTVRQGTAKPGTPVTGGPQVPAITVRALWPHPATDLDLTLTGPNRYWQETVHMTRTAGDSAYALYTAAGIRLPRSAAPGTWTAAVAIGRNGTWKPGPATKFTVIQTPTITLHASTARDPHVGGKIWFTGTVGVYGARGAWHRLHGAVIVCLWWKTTQPGDQWACDHQFRTSSRGSYRDPEWPLHAAWYKVAVRIRGQATGVSNIVFVKVAGG